MSSFNREQFLFRLIASIVVLQLMLYALGAGVCAYRYSTAKDPGAICAPLREGLDGAVETALNVVLALLGGGAVAVSTISKRRDDPPPPEDDPRY